MVLNSTQFLTFFPEFGAVDPSILSSTITSTLIEVNGYVGITTQNDRRDFAVGLHVAHNLTILKRSTPIETSSTIVLPSDRGNVANIKSRQDAISFSVSATKPYELESTDYGARLKRFIENEYKGLGGTFFT